MAKALIVGSSVVDLTFYTKRIPTPGETVMGRFVQGLGGKGFNQAVACAKAGSQTSFLSALGEDVFAGAFEARLKELGIETALERIPGQATGAAAISVDESGANNIIVALGANERMSPAFLEKNAAHFDGAEILLMQFETNLDVVECALKMMRARNPRAMTILNPAPAIADLPRSILDRVDLLTPNESELATIAGARTANEAEVAEACAKIQGVGAVLATLGEKGCYHHPRGGKARSFPAFRVKATDTSGAGDAFNGGFAAGLLQNQGDLEASIRFGQAVAAISVTRPGTSASMPAKAEVEAFLKS